VEVMQIAMGAYLEITSSSKHECNIRNEMR
jgi:hypothetical protein